MILQRDIRTPPLQSERRLQGHRQEVCGLKWSTDHQLLASGGNDNKVGTPTPHWPGLSLSLPPGQPPLRAGVERVHPQGTPSEDRDGGRRHPGLTATAPQLLVWNHSSLSPVQQYTEHLAAVKAIAWSPHQHGLLASGGGTADRCIRFWNTLTGQPLQCIDTGSQVCNLAWSKHANELVSVGPQPGGTRPGARPGAAGGQSTSPGPVTASPGVLGEARPLPPGLRGPGLSQPAAPSPSSHHRVQGEGLSPWSAPRGRPVVLVPRGVLGPGLREEPQGPWRRLPTGEHARLLAEPDPGLEVPVSDAGGQADRPLLPGPLLGESAGPGAGGQPLQRRGLDPTARRLVPSGVQWQHRFGPPGPDSPPPCGEGRLCLLESLPGCLFSHACAHAHSRCQKCPVPTAAVVSGRFRVVCTRLEKEPVSRPCSFFRFLCHTRKKCSVLHLAYPLPSVTEQAVPPGDRVVASSMFSDEHSAPGLLGQPRACLPFPSWQPRLAVALGPDSLPLAPAILCWRGHLQGTRTMASVPLQAMSPDGEAIVTGAGDETLRFWNVFSKTRSTKVKWVGISASCPPARPLSLSPGRPPPPSAPLISPRGSPWVPCPSAPAWLCTPSHIAWGPQGLVTPHLGRWEAAHPSPLARSLGFPLG